MWWGGFSEVNYTDKIHLLLTVLIPMWWGGFSEMMLLPTSLKHLTS